ncbi:hypothetical protein [Micromonospora sp. NPDC047134]|uniref:YncE family protein n=1 Tax=Micromonospora sp. NPDC047134 TaxID=3154340 RepID=UPI0033C63F7F
MTATPMMSRRTLLAALGAVGAATLTGCEPDGGRTAGTLPDPLLVELDGGLAVLRGAAPQVLPHAIATADARFIHATAPDGENTALWRIDVATGAASERVRLPGRWVPQTVSTDGTQVALTTEEVSVTTERPAGRTETPVLIADAGGVRRRLRLPGNVVPEAFTTDHTGLFVLEWLPPHAPDRYRVRVVDLDSGVSGPLSTRLKEAIPAGAEEEMRGDGRQAVLAADRRVLYTLYTHQPDHQHTRDRISGRPGSDVHAFVHTLHLEQRWAYCVDLPHPFGQGPAESHAMAITPDGTRLLVVDVGSGIVADITTEELTVRRTAAITGGAGPAYAATDGDRLFVAAGTSVVVCDLADLGGGVELTAGEQINGLLLSGDGSRLHVAGPTALSWHDSASGRELGRLAVPGLTGLRGLA